MSIRVFVNGNITGPEAAVVPVFDRGFLFGDSVFETIGTLRGRLFALDEHLGRLDRSAALIGLEVPSRAHIESAIASTLAAAGNAESRVRVIVTRGGDLPGDLDPASADNPRLVVIVQPLVGPTEEMYRDGVAVEIVSVTRNNATAIDPQVKSGNYLNNLLALGEARRRRAGVHEAILCSPDGFVAEGATSNVFMVRGGTLWTPALGVGLLEGVTRGKVLTLARAAAIACDETRFVPDDLRGADEAFLTSAARGILPVTRVDGRPVGQGMPGPVTRRLMALYAELRGREVGAP
jgi:branched-chain amino acid aminotransferase